MEAPRRPSVLAVVRSRLTQQPPSPPPHTHTLPVAWPVPQAVLRSVDTKQGLVDAGHLKEGDLTAEDRRLPGVLSVIMVLASVGIPFGILIWNCFDHAAEKDVVDEADIVPNPMLFDVEIEDTESDSE